MKKNRLGRYSLTATCTSSAMLLLAASAFADNGVQAPWQALWGNQIQYLGFYNYSTDTTQALWEKNFPEISSLTNLVWADPNDPSVGTPLEPQVIVSRLVQSLAQIRAAGKKAIIPADFAFTGSFFDSDRSLSPTFDEDWANIYQPALAEYADTVVAFYPLDEPFVHMKDQSGSELEHVIATIKAPNSFPQWKAVGVFSSGEVNRGVISRASGKSVKMSLTSIPAGYDWVGMDCYYPEFYSCGVDIGGVALPHRSIPEYYSILESIMSPDQQLVLVPTAATYYNPNVLTGEESKYFLYAVSNPRVVALLAYNYPTDPTGRFDKIGIQTVPAVKRNFQSFFQNYVNNPIPFYPLTSATSNNVSPASSAANAIDKSTDTYYGSNLFAKPRNLSASPGGVYLDVQMQATLPVNYVVLKARVQNGKPLGFPKEYQILVANPANGKWTSAGVFTTQPDSNGLVTLTLPAAKKTAGVRIVPLAFGKDENLQYRFQVAEVGLLGSF